MAEIKHDVGKDVLDALQFLDNNIEEMLLDVETKNTTKDKNGIFPTGNSTKPHSTDSRHHVNSPLKKPQLTDIQELQVGATSHTIEKTQELERKLKFNKPATEIVSEPSLTRLRQGPPTYPKPRITPRPKSMVEIPPSRPAQEYQASISQKLKSLQTGFHKPDGLHTVDEPKTTAEYHTKNLDNLSNKDKPIPRKIHGEHINDMHFYRKPSSKFGSKVTSTIQSTSVPQDLPLISASSSVGLQKNNDIITSPSSNIRPPSKTSSQPCIPANFPQSQMLNGSQDKYFQLPRASLGERGLAKDLAPAQSFSLPRNFGVDHLNTQPGQSQNGKYHHDSLKIQLLQTNLNVLRNRNSSSATEISFAMPKFPAPPPHTASFSTTDSSRPLFSLPRARSSTSTTAPLSSPHLQTSTATHSSFPSHHIQTSTSPRNCFSSSHVQNPNSSLTSSGNPHCFQRTTPSVVVPISSQNRADTPTRPFGHVQEGSAIESRGQRVPNRVQMRPQNTSNKDHIEALKKLGLFKM
uniref:uncharacterized protein n=1 Tax=Myxine glutinosa TaxID=7769 RepID=UPI00358E5410